MRSRLLLSLLVPILAGFSIASCGGDFDPQSLVNTVRVFATRANDDKSYAAPGESVTLEVLAFDGRPDKRRPMKITWLPFVCENPPDDSYYACFAQALRGDAGAGAESGALADAGDGGGSGAFGALRTGVDLTPFLPSSASTTFTMPADAITSHEPPKGSATPYGLVILFNIACAGHLELVDDSGPNSVPIGCFDDDANRLGADDYVFGFTRVYAYASRRNANPAIAQVLFQGSAVDATAGITIDHCTTSKSDDCPLLDVDVSVSDASWEINPDDIDPDGVVRHEQIWADYYSDIGQIDSDARLLYDPRAGKIDGSKNEYQAPSAPIEGNLWIVVHDNRGGVNWLQIPLHVH